MSDPLDIEAIDTIRFITGLNIKPLLAMASEIKDAISQYYDKEKVLRTKGQRSFVQRGSSIGKMELIWGSNLNMPTADKSATPSAILSREDYALELLTYDRMRIDALITLLIEKGHFTREELASMINQKKKRL